MPRTLVVVATYNERENIQALVDAVLALGVPDLDMLVVDDNSPDGTGRIADDIAAREPRLEVLHREGKLGLGTALCAGIQYARRGDYDHALTMDADFSHNPDYIPAMLERMAECDVVIGSRYVPGGGTRDWGRARRLMSWGANAFTRLMLRLRARDCSGGFKCYRVSLVARIDPASIVARGYAFQEELLYRCELLGARIGEVPILFEDRRLGETKMSLGEVVGLLTTIVRLRWRRLRGRLERPARRPGRSAT